MNPYAAERLTEERTTSSGPRRPGAGQRLAQAARSGT